MPALTTAKFKKTVAPDQLLPKGVILKLGDKVRFQLGSATGHRTSVYCQVGRHQREVMPTFTDGEHVEVTEIYATSMHGASAGCAGEVHLVKRSHLEMCTLDENILIGAVLGNF